MHGAAPESINAGHEEFSCATLNDVPFRVREFATLRGLGYSFRQIANLFNVTPQAVSLTLERHRRTVKSLGVDSELAGLSARAVNVLGRHRVSTRAQARMRNLQELLKDERNCGRKTLEEIARWMSEVPSSSEPVATVAEECPTKAVA